jgi:hypothetical protein
MLTLLILAGVRFNWKLLRLAIIPALGLLSTGCSGINASGSVSPATFLLPGFGKARTDEVQPAAPISPPEAVQTLAQSH